MMFPIIMGILILGLVVGFILTMRAHHRFLREMRERKPLTFEETRIMIDGIIKRDVQ